MLKSCSCRFVANIQSLACLIKSSPLLHLSSSLHNIKLTPFILIYFAGTHTITFVAMDAQNGAGLNINEKGTEVVALGPNININLHLSPTKGGKD